MKLLPEKNKEKGIVQPAEVIRFHVKAHSNSPEEQRIKNYLAQKTVALYGSRWGSCCNREELRSILSGDQKGLEVMACKTLAENGFEHDVRVSLEKGFFPARLYEGTLYPPGEYEALYMIIGDGAGENWWCVLFPPLCFSVVPQPPGEDTTVKATGEKGENICREIIDKQGLNGNKSNEDVEKNLNKPKCRLWLVEFLSKILQRCSGL